MDKLQKLLLRGEYFKFLEDIAFERYPVKDVYDWLEWFNGSNERLAKVLKRIAEILWVNHYTVIYPADAIIIPRYPFTKQPIISWKVYQKANPSDHDVVKLKEICGLLGNLINASFIARRMLVVDFDSGVPSNIDIDYKTRRGAHKVFFIKDAEAILFKFGTNEGFKLSLNYGNIKIEIFSGPNYLAPHPLQSRWLEFSNGKVHVKSYKIVSREASIVYRSGDTTLLEAKAEDIIEWIRRLISDIEGTQEASKLEAKPIENVEEAVKDTPTPSAVNPKRSRFNEAGLTVLGSLTYNEFKELLEPYKDGLPTCLKNALYGFIEKGHRYFHLRLLLAVVPFFVTLTDSEIEALLDDFASRTNSTKSDLRRALYNIKYFTGRIMYQDREVVVPSKFGVPPEAWTDFETLGYCNKCPIAHKCLTLPGWKRRRLIVQTVEDILLKALGLKG